jgi:hypothetical protein
MAAPGQTPQTADPAVAELQRVLTAYAQVTGFAPAFPGTVDGIVGVKTAMAVAAMIPRLPGMPSELVVFAPIISLALVTEDGRTQAFSLIKRNAGIISKAIIALEAYRLAQGQPPAPIPPQPGGRPPSVMTQWASGIIAPTQNPITPGVSPDGTPTVLVPWWNTTRGKVAIGAGVAGALLTVVVVIRAFLPGR